MMNSLTYLTRRCPRKCGYCALRDAKDLGPELTTSQWCKAFQILKDLGVDFNLILGNETWLLGADLLTILRENKVPYALYTTAPEPLWSKYHDMFFNSGIIDNLSCGMDYPIIEGVYEEDDSYHKSVDAWKAFKWIKEHHPNVDTQGTITIHRKNIMHVPHLVEDLSDLGIFVGINFIHWNKDGGFDFFPSRSEIMELLFTEDDYPLVEVILNKVYNNLNSLLQNPEFIKDNLNVLLNMGWHCKGNPYGGPTIDADGSLRCCGYRKGTYTPKMSIFDLPGREDEWKERVYQDAMECPGCAWSYPWMFHYWEATDCGFGNKVFKQHAGRHIDESKWTKRNLK